MGANHHNKMKALRAAFPYTLPILTGYLLLGSAYGILMSAKGFTLGWTVLMSILVYAGAMQFVAVTLLTAAFNPWAALFIALMVNVRHLFYGISLLEKYKDAGKLRPFLIFGMTDEAFSIICSTDPPPDVDRNYFMFFITLLAYLYWISGSALGSLVGSAISFNVKGLDFVLTALFVVIFIGQWRGQKNHLPAIIGVAATIFCLVLFGQAYFIIPSMLVILAALTIFRKSLEDKRDAS
ncbi:MAG: AzlC family ABC transporter permease [Clostridia bacterium]|jgi:4-azaleucine resistance transporter AzlC|nr:AzlC family ABC transporter permease [Clostridia bacterium]